MAVPEPPHHGADRHLLPQQQLQNRRHSGPAAAEHAHTRGRGGAGGGRASEGRGDAGIPAGEAGPARAGPGAGPPPHVNTRGMGRLRRPVRVFSSHARYLLPQQGPGPGLAAAAPAGRGGGRGSGAPRGSAPARPPALGGGRPGPPRRRMAEDSPKRRKANFNEAETEVLIEQVLKHEQLLFAAGPGRASPGQKRKVWELIRHKVNPVAACPRDVEDLKKRWRDLKRRDRSKLCRLSQGCGPPGPPAALGLLLAPEDVPPAAAPPGRRRLHHRGYGTLLPAEAVPIVGGIDTLELPGAVVGEMGECRTEPRPLPRRLRPASPHRGSRGAAAPARPGSGAQGLRVRAPLGNVRLG